MAHRFRLLKSGFNPAAFNMGLDQAILESVAASRTPPTLRLYGWEPAAVSIGYFQGLDEEVDVDACRSRGVDVVRRITGGGAVFHQAELTYSIVLPESHPLAARSVLVSYERICSGIVEGLALLGVPAAFAPINDILCSGRKVSGNAQTRKLGCILQHGTVLLDVDVELMFELLRVPSEKARGRLIQDVKARVAGLRALLGRVVSFAEAEDALQRGFRAELDLDYAVEAAPTAQELAAAAEHASDRFQARDWNYKR